MGAWLAGMMVLAPAGWTWGAEPGAAGDSGGGVAESGPTANAMPAGGSGGADAGGKEEPGLSAMPAMPSLASMFWDASLSLRAWGGYNDNPRLSALNSEGSALAGYGGEFLLLRVPVDGREVAFFALVEQVEYAQPEFDPETVVILNGRFRRRWEDGWSVGVAGEYLYLRQVFDASDIVGLPVIVPARGSTVSVRPVVAREWGRRWRTELELEGSRQWLEAPLDSFWDSGPKLSLVRLLGTGSELAFSYRYRRRMFDDRLTLDETGSPIPGDLVFNQHEFEIPWRQAWGASGRWRTQVRAGFLESLDNGGGYYDYHRFQLGASIRYTMKSWEARAEAKSRWYLYPVQTAGTGDDTRRRRDDLSLSVRGEWTIRKGLRVFGEYEFEGSDENVPRSDYRVNSATAGVELVW